MDGEIQESENAPLRITDALAGESALVRAVIAQENDEDSLVSIGSRQAFATVHVRLMDAVENDVVARRASQESTPPELPRAGNSSWLQLLQSLCDSPRARVHAPVARFAGALLVLIAVGLGGHHFGRQQNARALPIDSIVSDFDAGMKSPLPLDFISADVSDARPAAHWLTAQVGHKIFLPAPGKTGTQIVGARRHELWGRPVAQAHYLKNGVRVALYQIREPRAGLKGLRETRVHGRTFMTAEKGDYRVVVWRKGDDIMTMVSPLQRESSLRLAAVLREAAPDDAPPV
jgi:hypothetical protein